MPRVLIVTRLFHHASPRAQALINLHILFYDTPHDITLQELIPHFSPFAISLLYDLSPYIFCGMLPNGLWYARKSQWYFFDAGLRTFVFSIGVSKPRRIILRTTSLYSIKISRGATQLRVLNPCLTSMRTKALPKSGQRPVYKSQYYWYHFVSSMVRHQKHHCNYLHQNIQCLEFLIALRCCKNGSSLCFR